MIMENTILELLEQKGSISINDDIFSLVEKEFEGQVIDADVIYTKMNDTPYDFYVVVTQQLRLVTVKGYG